MSITSTSRATGVAAVCLIASALTACSTGMPDERTTGTSQSSATSATPATSSANQDAGPITEADVVGVWNNHHDPGIKQQIRFTADHQWHEDQHGKKDIYHGTWEITGDHTVMLHDWEEELRFTPGDNREFTVVSFDHVLTKDES